MAIDPSSEDEPLAEEKTVRWVLEALQKMASRDRSLLEKTLSVHEFLALTNLLAGGDGGTGGGARVTYEVQADRLLDVISREVRRQLRAEVQGGSLPGLESTSDLDLSTDALDAVGSSLSELNDRMSSFTDELRQRLDATEPLFADV